MGGFVYLESHVKTFFKTEHYSLLNLSSVTNTNREQNKENVNNEDPKFFNDLSILSIHNL